MEQPWWELVLRLQNWYLVELRGSASWEMPLLEIGLSQAAGERHWQNLDVGSDHGCCGTTWAPRGVWWCVASPIHRGTIQTSVSCQWGRRTMEGVEISGGPRWFLLGTGHGVPCGPLGGGVAGHALVAATLGVSKDLMR